MPHKVTDTIKFVPVKTLQIAYLCRSTTVTGRLFPGLVDHLLRVKVLMYADDTVIYCAGKDIESIENVLTKELEHVARYFDENELVINLKKGKTEVMLFGTAKRRSLQNRQLNITYRDAPINNSNEYTYLGYTLDNSLTLKGLFDKAYKNAAIA